MLQPKDISPQAEINQFEIIPVFLPYEIDFESVKINDNYFCYQSHPVLFFVICHKVNERDG